jgi:hypothetical protein
LLTRGFAKLKLPQDLRLELAFSTTHLIDSSFLGPGQGQFHFSCAEHTHSHRISPSSPFRSILGSIEFKSGLVVALIVTVDIDCPRIVPGYKNEVSRRQSEANWPPEGSDSQCRVICGNRISAPPGPGCSRPGIIRLAAIAEPRRRGSACGLEDPWRERRQKIETIAGHTPLRHVCARRKGSGSVRGCHFVGRRSR